MYFDKFSKINYDFTNADGTISTEMQDIFRRVKIKRQTLDNTTNYSFYIIEDGDTPEQVAFNLYGDSALWWTILLANEILDVNSQWAKGSIELNRIFDEFLQGQSLYVMENLNIHEDDVIVKRDTTKDGSLDINIWGIIDDYDSFFHKIDVKTNNASGTFSASDDFYIYRGTADGYQKINGFGATACAIQGVGITGCTQILGPTSGYSAGFHGINAVPNGPLCTTQGSTFSSIRRVTTIKSSLAFFESNNNLVNPYSILDGNSPRGVSGDFFTPGGNLCGLTATLLYQWVSDTTDGFPETTNTSIKAISRGADIIRKNDNKRKIKVLNPTIIGKIVAEFASLINKKVPPGTTKYITFQG